MLRYLLASLVLAGFPIVASAGDNNRVDLLQSATGSIGNTLTIDQSNADNSLVAGDPLAIQGALGESPAQQIGDDNTATLTLEGDGTRAFLEQGQIGNPAFGNEVSAFIAGLAGLGMIQQLGADNFASLTVTSESSTSPSDGAIFQDGNRNRGTLTVEGINVSGTLRQVGDDNVNNLSVSGQNSSVEFTQEGTGIVNSGNSGSPGVSVYTNAGNVSITQTNY